MHLQCLQGKITALSKNLPNSIRISQLIHTHTHLCAENSHCQHESYTKTHTHPWGTSRAAAFLCFLSAHRLFTKTTHKTKKAFPRDSVADAQGFDPGDTLPVKPMWHTFISHCLATVNTGIKCKALPGFRVIQSFCCSRTERITNSRMWGIPSGFGPAPELSVAGTVTGVPCVPCASSQQPHKSDNP